MIFPALNLHVDPGLEGIVFAPGSRSFQIPHFKAPLDNTELQDLSAARGSESAFWVIPMEWDVKRFQPVRGICQH